MSEQRLDKAGSGSVPGPDFNAVVDALGGKSPPTVSSITFVEQAGPDTPPPGRDSLFFDVADGTLKYVDSAGDVHTVGGGGSTPGAARVLGPFAFAFDTVGLAAGHEFYTPTVGDILLDAWMEVTTVWDGTTPTGDFTIGSSVGGDGLFSYATSISMESPDSDIADGDYGSGLFINASIPSSLQLAAVTTGARIVPGRITAADPFVVWVTQDGERGTDPPGGAAGTAAMYLVIATPAAS